MAMITLSARDELVWRVLGLLNLYRLLVPTFLLSLYFLSSGTTSIGSIHPLLFLVINTVYFALAILSIVALKTRWPRLERQAWLHIACDVAAIALMLHVSGGVSSGLGMLLVIPVFAVSLIVPSHRAFMVASFAAIALLAQQVIAHLSNVASTTDYTAAGVLGGILFVIALSARPLAERLRESEELVRQRDVDLANLAELSQYIVQRLRESILVVDSSDRIRLLNESAAQILGERIAGDDRKLTGALLGEVSPRLLYFLSTWRQGPQTPPHAPGTFVSDDGARVIQPHFATLGNERLGPVLIFLEDTSLLSERVQQSKLAALGRLSASIAHEIRNPIGAMSHAGQLLAESPNLSEQEKRLTEIIRANSERVSTIINNVLQLSRRDATRPERMTLGDWLEEFRAEFCQTTETPLSVLPIEVEGTDIEMRFDPSHLHQVLWNLCENALKYASREPPSRQIDSFAAAAPPVPAAPTIDLRCGRVLGSGRPFLEVADRGPGVDVQVADKIFEPFFTGGDGGTGLGLFIARELCQCNGALLLYEPRASGGSIFRVVFADPQRWED